MESIEELHAFIDALREKSTLHPVAGSFDCAGPYDGRTRSFIATLPTAFVLAASGLPVTLHGGAPLPPKWGVTLPEVLRELGIVVNDLATNTLIDAATASGFLFVPSESWCPPLAVCATYGKSLVYAPCSTQRRSCSANSDSDYMQRASSTAPCSIKWPS